MFYLNSFFFTDTPTTEIYTLSLHDALPISIAETTCGPATRCSAGPPPRLWRSTRSEEHTSELQSRRDIVCRLLLEKKKLCMSGIDCPVREYSPRVLRISAASGFRSGLVKSP